MCAYAAVNFFFLYKLSRKRRERLERGQWPGKYKSGSRASGEFFSSVFGTKTAKLGSPVPKAS